MATIVSSFRTMAAASGLTYSLSVFTAILLVLSVSAQADSTDVRRLITPKGGLSFSVQTLFYENPAYEGRTLVELPFSLFQEQLTFWLPDAGEQWVAALAGKVVVLDTLGLAVDSASTLLVVPAKDSVNATREDLRLFGSMVLLLKPGRYSAWVELSDSITDGRTEKKFIPQLLVPSPESTLSLSTAALAYSVTYLGDSIQGQNPALVKNGYLVYPLTSGIIGSGDTLVSVYTEIYNLEFDSNTAGKYQVGYSLLGSTGEVLHDFGYKVKNKPGESAVEVQSFNTNEWPAQVAALKIVVKDVESGKEANEISAIQKAPSASGVRAMESEQLTDPYHALSYEQKLNLAHHFLSAQQRTLLTRLSDSGKLSFLEQFWRDADDVPTTRVNEARSRAIERYSLANEQFSSTRNAGDGWSSDRGRVLIVYGPWEERRQFPTPESGEPFEVWHYRSLDEGLIFVFQDLQGFHEYTLVHSNARGERFNRQWAERVADFLR